jgi:hypothetical protein
MRLVKIFFPALLSFIVYTGSAQNFGPSVYSRLGIGNIADGNFSRAQGMGGAGVGLHHSYQLNSLNPAALSSLKFTNFEFGIGGKRTIQRTTDDSQQGTSGTIQYLSLALPLHKRFVTQFGARPFSNINYKDNFTETIGEKTITTTKSGSGGLSEFFWSNAYNYKDWLMIGVNAGYVLGQSVYEHSQFEANQSRLSVLSQKDEKHLRISPGILITHELKRGSEIESIIQKDTLIKDTLVKKIKSELASGNWFLGVGITGDFYNTLSANEEKFQSEARLQYVPATETANAYYDYFNYKTDTLSMRSISGYHLPNTMKVGVSLYKPNKITFALDYTYSNWSSFTYNTLNSSYHNQHIVALGAEIIPDYNSIKFYKRISYRAGLNYNMLPYIVAGQDIKQIQANIGAGFVLPKSGVTLNTTLTCGQRGTTSANLVKENYWMLSVGIIANTKWFVRRKHE